MFFKFLRLFLEKIENSIFSHFLVQSVDFRSFSGPMTKIRFFDVFEKKTSNAFEKKSRKVEKVKRKLKKTCFSAYLDCFSKTSKNRFLTKITCSSSFTISGSVPYDISSKSRFSRFGTYDNVHLQDTVILILVLPYTRQRYVTYVYNHIGS